MSNLRSDNLAPVAEVVVAGVVADRHSHHTHAVEAVADARTVDRRSASHHAAAAADVAWGALGRAAGDECSTQHVVEHARDEQHLCVVHIGTALKALGRL